MTDDRKAVKLAIMVHWYIHSSKQSWSHFEYLFRKKWTLPKNSSCGENGLQTVRGRLYWIFVHLAWLSHFALFACDVLFAATSLDCEISHILINLTTVINCYFN